MKILITLLLLLLTFSTEAQYSTLSIVVKPNKNRTILVDGKQYTSNDVFRSGKKNEFTITDLNPGQHTITVISAEGKEAVTSFTLSPNYDMTIEIERNGSFKIREHRNLEFGVSSSSNIKPFDFTVLLSSIASAEYNSEKVFAVTNAFLNPNYHFTAENAVQLISVVTGDSNRLQLAKLSYSSLIDTGSFYQVINFFTNQSGRSELMAFITRVQRFKPVASMTNNAFSMLVSDIKSEQAVLDIDDAILAAFLKRGNRFTTSQAPELIELSGTENARLSLAKAAFKTLTDPGYFTQMYRLFSSQGSRNELAFFVSTANPTALYRTNAFNRVPMADKDFLLVADKVKQTDPRLRRSTVADIFASPYYLLTSKQISEILLHIKGDDDRLFLLKAAYRITIDRSNFNALADLLLKNSSKKELYRYTSTYLNR